VADAEPDAEPNAEPGAEPDATDAEPGTPRGGREDTVEIKLTD
jgi:hypothetical protein